MGICPACGKKVISKCGKERIWHWAHEANKNCDKWWEEETEWHRKWKNYFPEQWQEKTITVEEQQHRADIKTPDGLVIEFQHSYISSEEKEFREKFYKKMIWVFDKTRLKNDYTNFFNCEFRTLKRTQKVTMYLSLNVMGNSKVPIFFDFAGLEDINDYTNPKFFMYCILPVTLCGRSIITQISKQTFINMVKNNTIFNYLKNLESYVNNINHDLRRLSVNKNCSINYDLYLKYLQLLVDKLPIHIFKKKSESDEQIQSMINSFEKWVNERTTQSQ